MFKQKRVARIRTGLKYIARCMDVQRGVWKVVPRAEVYVHGGAFRGRMVAMVYYLHVQHVLCMSCTSMYTWQLYAVEITFSVLIFLMYVYTTC